jgi:manganese oxidase
MVYLLQDGLRHFIGGDPDLPVRDIVPNDDPEDSGQRGINYRSALINTADRLAIKARPHPPSPQARANRRGFDSYALPTSHGNHTFTLHGLAWPLRPWSPMDRGRTPSPASPPGPPTIS